MSTDIKTTTTGVSSADSKDTNTQIPAGSAQSSDKKLGIVKSGRVWKDVNKKPLRINALGVVRKSWERKKEERLALEAFKNKAKELKQEKEDERKRKVEERKERLKQKEEKERYDMLAKKMHAKVRCIVSLIKNCDY